MEIKNIAKRIAAAVVYGVASGMAIKFFLSASGLYTNGVTGLAQVISAIASILGNNVVEESLLISVLVIVLNIPLALLAFFKIGKKFTLYSFVSIIMSAVFIEVLPSYPITDDIFLNSVLGGIFYGVGVGVCLKEGFCTGGVDFIILYLQMKKGITVGALNMVFNGVIIGLAGFVFDWRLAMYTMISIFISSRIVNMFYTQQYKITLSIFTKEKDKIIEALHASSGHGVTVVEKVYGSYSGAPMTMLVTVISKYELLFIKEKLQQIDPNIFVNIQSTDAVIGKFDNPTSRLK